MQPTPSKKGIAQREAILDAAFTVFSSQGYDRTSVREVARAVGLTPAGVLHYFASKDDLFVEVLRERTERNIRDFGGENPVESLTAILRHNITVPGLVRLYATLSAESTDVAHPAHDYFTTRYRWVREELSRGVRAAQARGEIRSEYDADEVASVLLAVADGLQVQWLLDPSRDVASGVELVWDSFRRG